MLPCATQSIRIRDGKDAWMSELIGEYSGRGVRSSGRVVSSGNLVLIDFHLNDSQIVSNACYAGFIGHVEVIGELRWRAAFAGAFGRVNLSSIEDLIRSRFHASRLSSLRRVVKSPCPIHMITLFAVFRSAKRDNHRRLIHYGINQQGSSNCSAQSHALLRVPVRRRNYPD